MSEVQTVKFGYTYNPNTDRDVGLLFKRGMGAPAELTEQEKHQAKQLVRERTDQLEQIWRDTIDQLGYDQDSKLAKVDVVLGTITVEKTEDGWERQDIQFNVELPEVPTKQEAREHHRQKEIERQIEDERLRRGNGLF